MIGVVLSANLAGNTISSPVHGYVANDPVSVSGYGTLPSPLSARRTYYVRSGGLTADALTLATSPGGAAVDLTTEGALFLRRVPAVETFPLGSICVSDDVGTLTVNDVGLRTPAWGIPDLTVLWGETPPLRGSNVVLPGSSGQRPYSRRVDQNVVLLPIDISGVCDQTGALWGNDEIGLELNTNYLMANAFLPPVAPTATVAASLVTPSGATLTARVQVTGFHHGDGRDPGLIRAVLELTIPDGRFT